MENEVELCVEVGSNIGDTWVENADINQLCRSCANTHDNMIPIFEGDGLEHDLQNKIDKHFPVNISRDDGLPHQMCYQCASTLVAWHDMYMGCIDAENKLKNLLKKSTAKGQVEKTVAGSSIASAVSASVEPDSQQKMASEMEVDNDDNDDDDDDDDVPEHGGDDNDDEEDDDDDNDDEDEEVEEIVLHKLEAKAKEKNVEVNEKGTTIRDQIMVVRTDINHKQLISLALHMNGNEKKLELSTDFPESSYFGENESIIKEVVKYVRQKNGLSDNETLSVKLKSSQRKRGCESQNNCANSHKIDMKVIKLHPAIVGKGFYCQKCNLRYKHKHNFEAHVENHKSESENKLKVEETYKKTTSKTAQIKYKFDSSTKQSLYCEMCNRYLKTSSGYNYHMKHVHLGVKEHACDICGRCFAAKFAMIEHRRIHTGERPFICQVCGKAVRTRNILDSHLKLHSDERPYSCQTCHRTFKHLNVFRRHNVIHTGEKKYGCELCGKRFTSSTEMKAHKLTHNGLKPFACPLCDSTFNQKRYLKKHLRKTHCLESKSARNILQNFAPNEPKHISAADYKTPQLNAVNATFASLDVLQNVGATMNETDEASGFRM